jgi:hypothetical protein
MKFYKYFEVFISKPYRKQTGYVEKYHSSPSAGCHFLAEFYTVFAESLGGTTVDVVFDLCRLRNGWWSALLTLP